MGVKAAAAPAPKLHSAVMSIGETLCQRRALDLIENTLERHSKRASAIVSSFRMHLLAKPTDIQLQLLGAAQRAREGSVQRRNGSIYLDHRNAIGTEDSLKRFLLSKSGTSSANVLLGTKRWSVVT